RAREEERAERAHARGAEALLAAHQRGRPRRPHRGRVAARPRGVGRHGPGGGGRRPRPGARPGRQGLATVRRLPRAALAAAGLVLFVLATGACGKKGPPVAPERLDVTLLAAPAAPSGLIVAPGDKQVRLRWQAPTSLIDGGALSGEIRYVVLRAVGDGPLAPVTPEPVSGTSHTDTGIENDVA